MESNRLTWTALVPSQGYGCGRCKFRDDMGGLLQYIEFGAAELAALLGTGLL